jgi:uncharacterized protein (DUF885 family)
MRFAIARMNRIPAILATAKSVIADPPKVYIEIALENLSGAIGFFKTGVPSSFTGVEDPALQLRLSDASAKAILALQDYNSWLESALPDAKGDFALGARNLKLKLLFDEMVDAPLDKLLATGMAQLKKDQAAFVETARRIDPKATPDQVLASLEKDHPTADQLIPAARDQLAALRRFIVERNLTPLPPEDAPMVTETPGFERALIEAAMDPPGPLDTHATRAFYYITPPDPGLSPAAAESYLEGFNRGVLNNTSVHEVFPGHFVQLMLMRSLPDLSLVRRVAWTGSNTEGWAHYSEQMTLDEGFGQGDPKLRLAQIVDALLRDCRYVVAIRMHALGMTLDQATDFFVTEGHQTRPMAEKEAKRGTADPTYLVYTLGKLEILKLRDDWKAKMGDQYSIAAFHKRFLEGGTVPIKLIRREMMGQDGGLL